MKKVVSNKSIYFYDEEDNLIMYIDHTTDDCIWYFDTDEVMVSEEMDLYKFIDCFMANNYVFNDDILENYKDENTLIWYSDCYYNPDDEWSIASVSKLTIEKKKGCFRISCTKKLDEMIERKHKTYGICFSPAGNGRYSKNPITGLTLQDEFVTGIYQPLLNENLILKLK